MGAPQSMTWSRGIISGPTSRGPMALGNAYSGVYVGSGSLFSDNPPGSASNVTIGGTAAGAGNVISANGQNGIWITGAGTTGVVVEHNFIGTDVTGTKALGNAYSGVEISGGAANNTIGGTTADAGNVISANRANGIRITGTGHHAGNVVAGQLHRHRRHRYEGPGKRVLRRPDRRRRGEQYHRRDHSRRSQRDLGQREPGIWITGMGWAPPGSSSSRISSAPTSPVRRPWETRTPASRSTEPRRTIRSAGPQPTLAT